MLIRWWWISRTGKIFNFPVEKSLPVLVLVNDKYFKMNETANPMLFNFLNRKWKF
jgi:hypothetical protein